MNKMFGSEARRHPGKSGGHIVRQRGPSLTRTMKAQKSPSSSFSPIRRGSTWLSFLHLDSVLLHLYHSHSRVSRAVPDWAPRIFIYLTFYMLNISLMFQAPYVIYLAHVIPRHPCRVCMILVPTFHANWKLKWNEITLKRAYLTSKPKQWLGVLECVRSQHSGRLKQEGSKSNKGHLPI